MTLIDLRSDTVTRPTPEMREAMRNAVVGNAAWNEDPTVRELEEKSARAVGKEAGLFVPSGTMGNQVAIWVHTAKTHGPEVICEARSHIYLNESAGIAVLARAQVKPVAGVRGAMPPEAVEAAIQPRGNVLKPRTALIALENTHNFASGAAVPLENHRAIREIAERHNIPVHLDGARVFNAAVALGVPASAIGREVDTVQFCFSKGLGAPVGSVVCGSHAFIEEARKIRQILGGALRQAGVLAAPALIGLETMTKRLHVDHENARRLAQGLAKLEGLRVDPRVDTNIVIFDVRDLGVTAAEFTRALYEQGVGFSQVSPTEVRAVTHNDVTDKDIAQALDVTARVVEALRAGKRAAGAGGVGPY